MLIDFTLRAPKSYSSFDSVPDYEYVTMIGTLPEGESAYQRLKVGPRKTFQERLRTARYAIEAQLSLIKADFGNTQGLSPGSGV